MNSRTSVTKPSSGSMLTNWPRLMNSRTSRKRSRVSATPSSRSCTKMQAECQVVCQVECLTWEVWEEVCQELVELVLALVPAELGLPSRRSINSLLTRETHFTSYSAFSISRNFGTFSEK